jgi:hypothetical protein
MVLFNSSSPEALPFENLGELRSEHDRLLERYSAFLGERDSPEDEARVGATMKGEIASFVARGGATGMVLDAYPERTAAQALVDYWVSLQIRCGADVLRHRLVGFDQRRLPELDDALCPYVGLEHFHDSTNFFGRDPDIERLTELVEGNPLVIVHGSSGSGKSSLVFAGLLPRLRAENARPWSTRSFTPGDDPAARLAAVNADLAGGVARHLIVVDQFEELFTLVSEEARDRFDAALATLLAGDTSVRVVVTVREEFYARLSRLSACATYADFSMRPLGYADLMAAIERPAARINLTFERGIVETLVAEVLGQPAALPLLQFSLLQLWHARSRNRITREALDRIGGPRDALARAADAFIERQIGETATEIRRVLVELVRVDDLLESYRQPVRRSALLAAGSPRTAEVVSLLDRADLVRVTQHGTEDDPIVEIKHEAIIRNWPRLDTWIVQKRKSRRNQLALLRSAQAWDAAGRPTNGLYRGWQLQETAELEGLSTLEQDFIAASHSDVDREMEEAKQLLLKERKLSSGRRLLLYGTAAALAFIAIAYWLQRNETQLAVREKEYAEKQRTLALEAKAEANRNQVSAARHAAQLQAQVARQQATLDSLTKRSANVRAGLVAQFQRAVIASRDVLAGKNLAVYSYEQVEESQALVSLMKAAGMTSDLHPKKWAIGDTELRYYYDQDKVTAERIIDLFDRHLDVKIRPNPKVKDPEHFGPNVPRPRRKHLELHFAPRGVPAIGTL